MTFSGPGAPPHPPPALLNHGAGAALGLLANLGPRSRRGKVSGRAEREPGPVVISLSHNLGLGGGSGDRSLQALHARYILSFLCHSPATRHKMCSESDISRSADSAASCPSSRTMQEGRTRCGRRAGLPGQGEYAAFAIPAPSYSKSRELPSRPPHSNPAGQGTATPTPSPLRAGP